MKDYTLVSDYGTLRRMVKWFEAKQPKWLYLDTETTGFNPRSNTMVALQLMAEPHAPCIIDLREATDEWFDTVRPLIQSTPIVGHNLSFDVEWLMSKSIIPSKVFCTQVAEQVINACGPKGITLKSLAFQYADAEMSKEERSWFIDLDQREEWNQPFPPEQLAYMANDLRYLPTIMRAQLKWLERKQLTQVAALEMRVLPAISWMQGNGVHVDVDGWREVIKEQEERAVELEDECIRTFGPPIIAHRQRVFDREMREYRQWEQERDAYLEDVKLDWQATGNKKGWGVYKQACMTAWRAKHPGPGKPKLDESPPNIGSSQQLMVAFAALGIKAKNCEEETLTKLVPKFPALKPLMAWKKCKKIVSTYGESLLARAEADGRIHPGVNQIGAETGRMSSAKPNWQNIPARTEVGKRLRQCVVAPEGHVLLIADYSIIELRILADLSGDDMMLEMFASGADLHTFTARKMFNLPDSMTDEEVKAHKLPNGLKARDIAKTINYGVAYGQSAFGFAAKFGVDVDTAQGFIDMWHASYPKASAWLERAGDLAVQRGYSLTVLGRKRFYDVPEYTPACNASWAERSAYTGTISAIKRQGANAVIQGTSAEITKLAVANFYERADREHDKLILVVHDELGVQTQEERAQEGKAMLQACMDDAARHFLKRVVVPSADVHVGKRWEH